MPKPPLDNLGLLHGCGNHWRLERDAVMGVRSDGVESARWMRECALAAISLGTDFAYHPMIGMASYIAMPLVLQGPMCLFADKVIIWLGRLTHDGYEGMVTLTMHRADDKPTILHLEHAALAGAAMQAAQHAMETSEFPGEYSAEFHAAGQQLWQDWWLSRLSAMAMLASAVSDFAARYS